ncbi:MAG: TIR domain-containing protein, partial [Vicinamibacterales bacterium]
MKRIPTTLSPSKPGSGTGAAIFVCYRRSDSGPYALSIAQALRKEFGEFAVYMDTSSIRPGSEWPSSLRKALGEAKVVVVVIGQQWATVKDSDKDTPRLAAPDDWVRQEVLAALSTGKLVLPVLIDGAQLPRRQLLPDELKPLLDRNAVDLRQSYFHHDIELLTAAIRAGLPPSAPVVAKVSWKRRTVRAAAIIALSAIVFVFATYLVFVSVLADTQSVGRFETTADLRWNGGRATLQSDLRFVDADGNLWVVPRGTFYEGVAFPRGLEWALGLGSRFGFEYVAPTLIHDYYSSQRQRTWQSTHRAFYEA